jgi:bla regulator protein BlaR1
MLATILLAAILNTQSDGYVLMLGERTLVEGGSFNVQEISAIREAYGPNVFWFRASGRSYIIRDAAILKQIDDLFDPQRVLGAKQAALGEKQAVLGQKQAELGLKQGGLGLAQASAHDAAMQRRLSASQDELGRRQEELGREQNALGSIQNDLGSKQEKLGREIRDKLGALTKEWISTGVAKPLN